MVLRLHSISRWCYLHHIPVLPRLAKRVNHLLFKCVLPPECSIGRGTTLHHHGWAIGIHPNVKIGRDCQIWNLVFIGMEGEQTGGRRRIIIGDRVNIHSGAKVLCKCGTLTIGEGSTIGPNAAVESDVPAHSLVTGVPARITSKNHRAELQQNPEIRSHLQAFCSSGGK